MRPSEDPVGRGELVQILGWPQAGVQQCPRSHAVQAAGNHDRIDAADCPVGIDEGVAQVARLQAQVPVVVLVRAPGCIAGILAEVLVGGDALGVPDAVDLAVTVSVAVAPYRLLPLGAQFPGESPADGRLCACEEDALIVLAAEILVCDEDTSTDLFYRHARHGDVLIARRLGDPRKIRRLSRVSSGECQDPPYLEVLDPSSGSNCVMLEKLQDGIIFIVLKRSKASRVSDIAIGVPVVRSEEHTSELQSLRHLVCRLLLEKKKK